MAKADQIKALLESFIEGDDKRFYSVAMQLAAREAKLGHEKLARELRALVDRAKAKNDTRSGDNTIPISRPRGDLANLLAVSYPKHRLSEMVLDKTLRAQLERIVLEQRQSALIRQHGLSPRRKLLLVGPPGTGKTLTGSVLSGELGLPLFQVRLDGLITKFMGETAAKLRQIFEATDRTRGVYFFDEFDAIGSQRGLSNDVGEVGRILNSFLQMIEQDDSPSLIVAATNHPEMLDQALYRRFDDVLQYQLPTSDQIGDLLRVRLNRRVRKTINWTRVADEAKGLSFAEVARVADESLKDALISSREMISEADIKKVVDERKTLTARLKSVGAD